MRHLAVGHGRSLCVAHRFSVFRVRIDVVARLSMKTGLQQPAIVLMSKFNVVENYAIQAGLFRNVDPF